MSSKFKLPKRVAGVRIPKEIRRQAKPLLRLLDQRQARALLGAALAAGAAVLAEQALGASRADGDKPRKPAQLLGDAEQRATHIAESLGRAVAQAIGSHLPRMLGEPGPTAH